MIKEFKQALGFLSIIPVKSDTSYESGDLGRSAAFFPLVGGLIGLLAAVGYHLLLWVFPPIITAILTTAIWISLSGGLHLDGLADCFDGMLNASSPQRRLEIMKDSRLGTFGGVGLILAILTRFILIFSLSQRLVWLVFPFAGALARWLLLMAAKEPTARLGGMGAEFANGLNRKSFLLAGSSLLIFLILCFLQLGVISLIAAAGAHLLALMIFRLARQRLGGFTGDVFGLIIECSELFTLLIFCAKAAVL
jgi:adenosylcobinamide-GDP ribazoletransferase